MASIDFATVWTAKTRTAANAKAFLLGRGSPWRKLKKVNAMPRKKGWSTDSRRIYRAFVTVHALM
jgi:hypothetical protein